MSEDISNPLYWKRRLQRSPKDEIHHSIFICNGDRWRRIEDKHREILAKVIGPTDSVLDAGCGYGRLLTLMPPGWDGRYLGIDISPDFVEMARELHPNYNFIVGDLRNIGVQGFDWAVMISIRPMVRRNMGGEVWDAMEKEIRRSAKKLLFLEYDEENPESEEVSSYVE